MLPPESNREGSGDPVAFMEAYLVKRKLWIPAWKTQLIQQIAKELSQMTSSVSS
jgi:TPP-dependent pyruvate/acetoin dehydrogenase alpha subunit